MTRSVWDRDQAGWIPVAPTNGPVARHSSALFPVTEENTSFNLVAVTNTKDNPA